MDHLYLIPFVERDLGPFASADHIMVEFDGDSLPRQRKKLQKAVEVDTFGNFAGLAVYQN